MFTSGTSFSLTSCPFLHRNVNCLSHDTKSLYCFSPSVFTAPFSLLGSPGPQCEAGVNQRISPNSPPLSGSLLGILAQSEEDPENESSLGPDVPDFSLRGREGSLLVFGPRAACRTGPHTEPSGTLGCALASGAQVTQGLLGPAQAGGTIDPRGGLCRVKAASCGAGPAEHWSAQREASSCQAGHLWPQLLPL